MTADLGAMGLGSVAASTAANASPFGKGLNFAAAPTSPSLGFGAAAASTAGYGSPGGLGTFGQASQAAAGSPLWASTGFGEHSGGSVLLLTVATQEGTTRTLLLVAIPWLVVAQDLQAAHLGSPVRRSLEVDLGSHPRQVGG